MEKIKIAPIKESFSQQEFSVLENILDSLVSNKEDLKNVVEYKPVSIESYSEMSTYEKRIVIVDDRIYKSNTDRFREDSHICILFRGKLDSETVELSQEAAGLGLFPIDRFYGERKEFSEIARFESVTKTTLRKLLASEYPEKEFRKPIDWKVSYKENNDGNDYLSLFADSATREITRKTKEVVRIASDYSKKLRDFRIKISKELKDLRELEGREDVSGQANKLYGRLNEQNLENFKPFSLLITGPTGCGKTLLARYISNRLGLENSFSRISLVNIPKTLIESELFGNFPGAFTGATFKVGKMISMAGGVVFLDEIGEIDEEIQSKLLTYLDDMKVLIEGYSSPEGVKVPVLIIAATNKSLKEDSIRGSFRSDLYQRFSYEIRVPALKERMSDFRYILSYLLQKYNQGKKVNYISLKAIEKLESYDYPGNFRELERVVRTSIMQAAFDRRDTIITDDIAL